MGAQEALAAAFATLFVTIDPIGVVPIFLGLTAQLSPSQRRRVALKGTLIATLVLLGFALAGDRLLGALGISMPAFRIAGGLLLLWIATEVLFERRNRRRAQSAETIADDEADALAVFPLAVPLLAGPGSIATAVRLMSADGGEPVPQLLIVATLLAVMAFTGLLLMLWLRGSRAISQEVSPM